MLPNYGDQQTEYTKNCLCENDLYSVPMVRICTVVEYTKNLGVFQQNYPYALSLRAGNGHLGPIFTQDINHFKGQYINPEIEINMSDRAFWVGVAPRGYIKWPFGGHFVLTSTTHQTQSMDGMDMYCYKNPNLTKKFWWVGGVRPPVKYPPLGGQKVP